MFPIHSLGVKLRSYFYHYYYYYYYYCCYYYYYYYYYYYFQRGYTIGEFFPSPP